MVTFSCNSSACKAKLVYRSKYVCKLFANKKWVKGFILPNRLIFSVHPEGVEPPTF